MQGSSGVRCLKVQISVVPLSKLVCLQAWPLPSCTSVSTVMLSEPMALECPEK
jgi:hypothetical protein